MDIMNEFVESMMGAMSEEERQRMKEKMMGCCEDEKKSMMPQTMLEMMPHCLTMMLPKVPKEGRVGFVEKMVETLMGGGCEELSEEEKKNLVAKLIRTIQSK